VIRRVSLLPVIPHGSVWVTHHSRPPFRLTILRTSLPSARRQALKAYDAAAAEVNSVFAGALCRRAELWSGGGGGGRADVRTVAPALTAEMEEFQKHVAQVALRRLPFRRAAVHKVLRAMRELWPRAKVRISSPSSPWWLTAVMYLVLVSLELTVVCGVTSPSQVYVFGSVATGLALPSSDVDLVVGTLGMRGSQKE
jgi:hypothetical protein